MKVVGYEGCEIGPWGYMPNDDPKVLKNAMDARGLTLVGATEGGNFLDDAAVEGMLRDIDDIFALLKLSRPLSISFCCLRCTPTSLPASWR